MSTSTPQLNFSIDIHAPLQSVWAEISRLDSAQRFYFDSVLVTEWQVGSPLKYQSSDGRIVYIVGEILELAPPRRWVHTFQFTNMKDSPTRVTWELEELSDRVKVSVTHDQFDGKTDTYRSISRGWPSILKNLKWSVERGRLPLTTRISYAMMKVFIRRMFRSAK